MKNFGFFFLITISIANVAAFADEEEGSPFTCVEKTAALYAPSKNWGDLQKYFDGHLGFIFGSLKGGKLEQAGPFLNKDKAPEGGLMVTTITDRKEVEELFKQDPFVANDVVKVEYKIWNHCVLKK